MVGPNMPILSIQSQLVTSQVGNEAACLGLQRLGHDVWRLPTIILSHHPGHGGAQGSAVEPACLSALLDGMDTRGIWARCEGIMSGYLARASTADIVLRARRSAPPGTRFLCDPVIGDAGRLYVPADVAEAIRDRLLPVADIATPNQFELEFCTGRTLADEAAAIAAMRALGPPIILLTSFAGSPVQTGALDMLLTAGPDAWRLRLPSLPQHFSGAGDLLAALFFGLLISGWPAHLAMQHAASAVFGILSATLVARADELCLVAAQGQILNPTRRFEAELIG